ncbi:MAG TPA: Mov34/MPN/PAD-1 family protein [Thermoanaerobaculia bacterium]|nr:Mov34/MPN/PAD-1 family protein [Thermoanaerobaculia bacterium]
MREVRKLTFHTKDRRFGLVLSKERLSELLTFCRQAGPRETGGLLIGRYSAHRDLAVVSHVTGPARDSMAGRTWFHRGVAGLQDLLFQRWRQQEYYLGEWHSHPGAEPVPSGIDADQMRSIACSPGYHCPEPILLIVGGNLWGEWTLRARVYRRGEEPQDMTEESK